MADGRKTRVRLSQEKKDEIKKLYAQGNSVDAISKIMGLKNSQVAYHVKKVGIEKSTEKCKTCIYGTARGYCMYILVKEHKRPCVADDNCTEYIEGEHIAFDNMRDPMVTRGKITLKDCYSQAIFD